MLTIEQLKGLLDYDKETGTFTWLVQPNGRVKVGTKAGRKGQKGYVQIMIRRVSYKAHRLAWFYVHGEWPKHQIDHINGVPDDNRIANLRDVVNEENAQNSVKAKRNNKLGVKGVHFKHRDKRYWVQISVNSRTKWVGSYATLEEAKAAYFEAKEKYHPGYIYKGDEAA